MTSSTSVKIVGQAATAKVAMATKQKLSKLSTILVTRKSSTFSANSSKGGGEGGWNNVLAGLQLVATTTGNHVMKEANAIALRTTTHGMDLLTSSQKHSAAILFQKEKQGEQPFSQPSASMQSTTQVNEYQPPDFVGASSSPPPTTSSSSNNDNVILQEQQYSDFSHQTVTQNSNKGDQLSLKKVEEVINQNQNFQQPVTAINNNIHEKVINDSLGMEQQTQQIQTQTKQEEGTQQQHQQQLYHYQQSQPVPSTRIGRAFGFAQLGVGLAFGTASQWVSRLANPNSNGNNTSSSSILSSAANSERLANTLCRMRGAALKLGQMLSIQDESLLPPQLSQALNQVRQGAYSMPEYQLKQQLTKQLSENWQDLFESFDMKPFAAASIGQVHRATIRNPDNGTIQKVVVKVQYPGVAQSIHSDLNNLSMLMTMTGLIPKGLFLDNVIRVARQELQQECDYMEEAKFQKEFQTLIQNDQVLQDNRFVVPDVIPSLTTDQVITTTFASGGTIDKVYNFPQEERDRIGRAIMYLTMKELFTWRLMQTDPNWGNFLYDVDTKQTSLIDFGATRRFPKEFVDGYLRIVWASANKDKEALLDISHAMHFLTGQEEQAMVDAHISSAFTVGEPFFAAANPNNSDQIPKYDFKASKISSRMSENTSVFLRKRLTPPPDEVYMLHRKLAGAYMLCIKLGAIIACRDLLEDVVANHVFDDGRGHPISP